MNYKLSMPSLGTMRRLLAAGSLAAASVSSWGAVPSFQLDPSAAGLNGGGVVVTGDNFTVSDYATTVFTSPFTFMEQGYLSIVTIDNGGGTGTGFDEFSNYGLYISFVATGTVLTPTSSRFDSLEYTLYGYNGPQATFGFVDSPTNPMTTISVSPASSIELARGSLVPGSGSVENSPDGPSAGATVTFVPVLLDFFKSPVPFYTHAITSFINTSSQVEPLLPGPPGGVFGFRIRQGGGAFNFVAPVPEPETYAMLLAGLAVVGFVANRRKR